jgi:hypothetical protein
MPNVQTFHDMDQEAPSGLFSSLMQAWGYGSLGNMQAQRIAAADELFPGELTAQRYPQFNSQFQADSPRARLKTLKAMHFTPASKAGRVRRSLQALSLPLGIELSAEQWALIAEASEEDDG